MPNSIDFYKGIFLHVTPVRIIVPCAHIPSITFCWNTGCIFILVSHVSNQFWNNYLQDKDWEGFKDWSESSYHLIFPVNYNKNPHLYWEGLRFLQLILFLFNLLLNYHKNYILKELVIHWYSLARSSILYLFPLKFISSLHDLV